VGYVRLIPEPDPRFARASLRLSGFAAGESVEREGMDAEANNAAGDGPKGDGVDGPSHRAGPSTHRLRQM